MPNSSAYRCPQCGSDDTQRLAILHDQGTNRVSLRGMSISTDMSVGIGGGTLRHQSELAKKLAPPRAASWDANPVGALLAIVLLVSGLAFYALWLEFDRDYSRSWGVWLGQVLALLVSSLISAASAYGVYYYLRLEAPIRDAKHKKWQRDMAEWQKTYFCKRCGHSYVLNAADISDGGLINDPPH